MLDRDKDGIQMNLLYGGWGPSRVYANFGVYTLEAGETLLCYFLCFKLTSQCFLPTNILLINIPFFSNILIYLYNHFLK